MQHKSSIVSPEGALSFLFSIFALLMWYISVSDSYNNATLLSIGLTWLILSTGALMASLINMIRGSRKGNVNLLITILLGFFPGINTLISMSANTMGFNYQPRVVGIMYMVGAIFCFGASYVRRTQPLYIFLRTLFVSAGLFLVGLGDLSGVRFFLSAGGWFLFVYALLSFYYGLSRMYPYYGKHLPQGKAAFPVKGAAYQAPALKAYPAIEQYDASAVQLPPAKTEAEVSEETVCLLEAKTRSEKPEATHSNDYERIKKRGKEKGGRS